MADTRSARRRRPGALVLAAALLAVGTGCAGLGPGGDPDGPGAPDDPVTSTTEPAPTPSDSPSASPPDDGPGLVPADLTVEVDATGEGAVRTATLTCDPPGGDHPDPAAGCAAVAAGWPDAFAPVPPGVMCTEIWGGPQTAHVTGTIDGERVDATFRRSDGCQIARWDAVADLLGDAGAL